MTQHPSPGAGDRRDFAEDLLLGDWDLYCPTAGQRQDAFVLDAHVAGFAEDPEPVQGPFTYDCPEAAVPDGGIVDEDASGSEVVDTGVPSDGPDGIWEAAPASSGSAGCAMTARSAPGDGRWVLLIAFCGAHLLSSRRRPSSNAEFLAG